MGIFLYVHQLDRKDQLNNTNADRNQQVDQYLEKRQLMMRNTLSVIAADSSWSELIFADDSYLKNVAINKQSEHLRVLRQHIPETDMVSFVDHINGGVEALADGIRRGCSAIETLYERKITNVLLAST